MNKSFFRGLIAGSILGSVYSMFSSSPKKPMQHAAVRMVDSSLDVRHGARRVLKGISKGVSDIIK